MKKQPREPKKPGILGGIISAVGFVFFLVLGLAFLPTAASFVMLLAATLLFPLGKWRAFLRNKLRLSAPLKILAVCILFVVAVILLPADTSETSSQPGTPAVQEETLLASEETSNEQTLPEEAPAADNKTSAEEENESDPAAVPETEPAEALDETPTTPPVHLEAKEKEPDPKPEPDGEAEPADVEEEPVPEVPSTFSIHFIDVGQADAALVECDGHYALIDGGNEEDSQIIYSVLKKANVSKLVFVVGTHAHEDHIGGIPGAYSYCNADLTLCPVTSYDSDAFADFAKYAKEKGGGITVPSVGDTYDLGSAAVSILGVNGGSDTNDTSIILKIQYGETSFLFTGDAERDAEQTVLASGADLSATVLKVGHHGSDTSTTYPFLREIMPAYAVISVGNGNSYGHPNDDALSRLRDADVTVYRTDLQGDIICTSDGKNVTFQTVKSATAEELLTPGSTKVATEPVVTPEPAPEPEPEPEATAGTDYVGNKNSKKFHYAWCGSVDKMKESNKYYYTGTREEMINKGYDPCKNCNP